MGRSVLAFVSLTMTYVFCPFQAGDDANPGLIPLSISEIFRYIEQVSRASPCFLSRRSSPLSPQHAEREFLLRVSYMEIYNETLRDLLNPSTVVRIRQDKQVCRSRSARLPRGADEDTAQKRFFASPLQEEVVTTEDQVHDLIQRGAAARQVGQTDYNARSSRSHSVFQVVSTSHLLVVAAGSLT